MTSLRYIASSGIAFVIDYVLHLALDNAFSAFALSLEIAAVIATQNANNIVFFQSFIISSLNYPSHFIFSPDGAVTRSVGNRYLKNYFVASVIQSSHFAFACAASALNKSITLSGLCATILDSGL